MNITNLPRDMLLHEIFPKMELTGLLELSRNKATYEIVVEYLSEHVIKYMLPYSPSELMKFGHEYPFAIPIFISSILMQMHHGSGLISVLKESETSEPNNSHKWDWGALSSNPNISFEDMINNSRLYFHWRRSGLSEHPEISIDDILSDPRGWKWEFLSQNRSISLQDIESNPTLPWKYDFVSKNPNLTMTFVKRNLNKKWDWSEISQNPGITLENILDNPDLPWEYHTLIQNSNITPIDIKENPMRTFYSRHTGFLSSQWDHNYLGMNPNFSIYDLSLFPNHKFWYLNYNKNFTFGDVNKLPGQVKYHLHSHPDLTLDIVKRLKVRDEYQTNPVFTLTDLLESGLPLDKTQYSSNPTITNNEILDPEIQWYYDALSANKFIKDPDYQFLIYRELYRNFIPNNVTLDVNGFKMEVDKEFAYGFLVTIKTLQLQNFFTVNYIRHISNSQTGLAIGLIPDNYQMFTVNTARQPYMVKIKGKPFHFSHINFLNGVKSVYDSVKLPFNIKFYYDKTHNYQKILVE